MIVSGGGREEEAFDHKTRGKEHEGEALSIFLFHLINTSNYQIYPFN